MLTNMTKMEGRPSLCVRELSNQARSVQCGPKVIRLLQTCPEVRAKEKVESLTPKTLGTLV